jgi:hypothetical protein
MLPTVFVRPVTPVMPPTLWATLAALLRVVFTAMAAFPGRLRWGISALMVLSVGRLLGGRLALVAFSARRRLGILALVALFGRLVRPRIRG